MSWIEDFDNSVCTAEQLGEYFGWDDETVKSIRKIEEMFPMRITKYYLSLIDKNDPDDPIARMCIPSEDELGAGGSFDTSGEQSNTVLGGVQHKYQQTALILSTNVCAMYCRHCFRKRLVGISDSELNKQVDDAKKYVKEHPEVNNVLITGGDALMNPNNIIERYLKEFSEIETLDFIRFGSRVPVTFPQRIYDDPELIAMFEKYSKIKPIYLVTQFNHAREITPEALKAIDVFRKMGIQIRNQTVLLRGVNDKPETLAELLRALTRSEIAPYYVFQCRPVRGVKGRFQVPLAEGVKIVDTAKTMVSGIGKPFRYCMSHPLGKIEILGQLNENEMLFKFHQSKYPENAERLFTAEINEGSTWLDGDLNAI